MMRRDVLDGLRDGMPIAMGYFAVAFSIGMIAKWAGLTAIVGFVSSFLTRASAGEYGVYTLIAAGGAYAEVVAMCVVTNIRYLLMSAALSQRMAPGMALWHRLLMACCITDEVFGVTIARKGYASPAYMYAASFISTMCWAGGCAMGIVAGSVLPPMVVCALSVALYGMFLAIIMPAARADHNVLYAVICGFVLSGVSCVTPILNAWSNGTRTIVITVLVAAGVAWLRPVKDES